MARRPGTEEGPTLLRHSTAEAQAAPGHADEPMREPAVEEVAAEVRAPNHATPRHWRVRRFRGSPRIELWAASVVVFHPPIRTVLRDVAGHIVQSPRVGAEARDRGAVLKPIIVVAETR